MPYRNGMEHITCEDGTPDAWVCLCGNETHLDGFFPYHDGREVEPDVDGPWDGERFFCARCNRVITQGTLEVVERPDHITPLR